jgi:hypothetical protein
MPTHHDGPSKWFAEIDLSAPQVGGGSVLAAGINTNRYSVCNGLAI